MNNREVTAVAAFEIFHPVEHSIISHWMGVAPPDGTPDFATLPVGNNEGSYIGLEPPEGEYSIMAPCQNAVARIALRGVQKKLPVWAAFYGNGVVVWGRDPHKVEKKSTNIALLPQFLFGINWADSAPGFSWPEYYYMTYLPWYEVFVVTASRDSSEWIGYNDFAYGWFPSGSDIQGHLENLFVDKWSDEDFGGAGECWEYFWEAGVVREDQAVDWALQVNWVEGFPEGWHKRHGVIETIQDLDDDYLE